MARPRKRRPERYELRFFGRRLEELVRRETERSGRTQGQVAELIGVAEGQLSRWLLGHAHPSPEAADRLELLGMEEEEIEFLEALDKIDYLRGALGVSPGSLMKIARRIAQERTPK